MTIFDSLSLAYRTVSNNKLRTGITVAIIAFGIMALVGIMTAIDAINQSLRDNFSSMGANGFKITYKEGFRFGGPNRDVTKTDKRKKKKSNLDKPITLSEAENFKKSFNFPAQVSITLNGRGGNEVSYKGKKTNPNVGLRGGDENYLLTNGYTVEFGRNFNHLDVETGRSVCILGSDVANKLFNDNPELALDKMVTVGNFVYRVIGVLKAKGSNAMMRQDNIVLSTYNNVRRVGQTGNSFVINVQVDDIGLLDPGVAEATAKFRGVRKLVPSEDDNFIIEKSDKLAETFIGLLSSLQFTAFVIGLITLGGAAIGLMNIMLVAVNERTKEIGLIKAIGGKRRNVRDQFLFESVLISLMGAMMGIILGIMVGNLFASFMGTGFVIPWRWVVFGIGICAMVGLGAGLWPALKASKLNPINALRYE